MARSATLRRDNRFWDMIARLIERDKLHCVFVTRSDTAAGLMSVQFVGPVQPELSPNLGDGRDQAAVA